MEGGDGFGITWKIENQGKKPSSAMGIDSMENSTTDTPKDRKR